MDFKPFDFDALEAAILPPHLRAALGARADIGARIREIVAPYPPGQIPSDVRGALLFLFAAEGTIEAYIESTVQK